MSASKAPGIRNTPKLRKKREAVVAVARRLRSAVRPRTALKIARPDVIHEHDAGTRRTPNASRHEKMGCLVFAQSAFRCLHLGKLDF
jgi:hypothetical protein